MSSLRSYSGFLCHSGRRRPENVSILSSLLSPFWRRRQGGPLTLTFICDLEAESATKHDESFKIFCIAPNCKMPHLRRVLTLSQRIAFNSNSVRQNLKPRDAGIYNFAVSSLCL